MTSSRLGFVLVALGAIVVLLSALADPLGLGSGGTGFGWKQAVGVVVGAIVLAAGALVFLRVRRGATAESDTSTA